MKEEITNMINAIANQDAAAFQDSFNSVMSQKAIAAIDSQRIEVAKTMFTKPDAAPAEVSPTE